MKKYELTTDTIQILGGTTLFRIKALIDIGNDGVKAGDLGGYIEKEDNLSHAGNAWVADDARVYDNAQVSGNAVVYDNARVFGNAKVYSNARVFGNAKVYSNARVCGNAQVHGNARVYGDARVFGDAHVYDDAWVFGDAKIAVTSNDCEHTTSDTPVSAVFNHNDVKAGDLGGYIDQRENLAHKDNCRVYDDASIKSDSRICNILLNFDLSNAGEDDRFIAALKLGTSDSGKQCLARFRNFYTLDLVLLLSWRS